MEHTIKVLMKRDLIFDEEEWVEWIREYESILEEKLESSDDPDFLEWVFERCGISDEDFFGKLEVVKLEHEEGR